MAAQSNIQSLLQDLSGVHSAGQAWVPSSVNNGNPNTAYNQPKVYQTNPAAGYIPPATNGFGNWQMSAAPVPAAPASQFQGPDWQALAAKAPENNIPAGFKGFPNILADAGGGWAPGTTGVGTPTTPPVTPPVTPPGTPTGGTNTGGNLPPAGGGGTFRSKLTGPNDPLLNGGLTGGRGLQLLDLPEGFTSGMFSTTRTDGSVSGSDFGNAFKELGDMNVNLGSVGVSLSNTSLGRALGIKTDGTINVAQIADLFIPSNVYMSQTGQMNWANLIPTLAGSLNPVLGFAVTKLMNYFGHKYANEDDSKLGTGLAGWWRRLVKNRYLKNQANKNAGRTNPKNPFVTGGGGGGPGGVTSINPFGGMGNFNGGQQNPGGSFYYWGNTNNALTHDDYVNNVEGGSIDRGWFGTPPSGLASGTPGSTGSGALDQWGINTGPNYK